MRYERVSIYKKVTTLVLTLMLICNSALAGELLLSADAGVIHYSFELPEDDYAIVQYRSNMENGKLVVHGENGKFSGDIDLAGMPAGGRTTVSVLNMRQVEKLNAKVEVPSLPGYQQPTAKGWGKVEELQLTSTLKGFTYRFKADGFQMVQLVAKHRMQNLTLHLTPAEDGWFSGEVEMDYVYAGSKIRIQILSGNGQNVLKEGEVEKGYAPIPVVEKNPEGRLKGITVCIDAGHQLKSEYVNEPLGPNMPQSSNSKGGMAQGRATGRLEHMVTLEAAYVLQNELLRQGADVVMTRTKVDQFISSIQRAEIGNQAQANITLRLHCDYAESADKYGISIHCPMNSEYARAVTDRETYKAVGEIMLNDMRNACKIKIANHTGYVVLTDKFVGNNWAKMLCFLVEMGFMSNNREDMLMSCPAYQQDLAEGMAQGVYDIGIKMGWIQE